MNYHVEPIEDTKPHSTDPGCPCRPILKGGYWVHRSFDGREMDQEGHEITVPAPVAEYLVFYAYRLHGVSKPKVLEVLQITPEAFDRRYADFLERYKSDTLDRAADLLCPSGS